MRFLVDAQLPPALARWLTENGHEAQHVADIGLEEAKDRMIWKTAIQLQAVIITKDEDFFQMATLGSGPQVVWIKSGNTSRRALLKRMAILLPLVVEALQAGEHIVEIW